MLQDALVANSTLIPIFIVDFETFQISYSNDTASEKYGYSISEFRNMTINQLEIYRESNIITNSNSNHNFKSSVNSGNFVSNHETKGGKILQVEIISTPIDFNNQKSILVICKDITNIKAQENRDIQLFKDMEMILDNMDHAFFTMTKLWIVTFWNSMAEKIVGVKKSDIIGSNLWEIFSDRTESIAYKKYNEALKTNVPVKFESYVNNKWYDISAYPSHSGLSVYFHDITDRKLSELKMIELNNSLERKAKDLLLSNSEIEQFAYVASHDLQEPLRMVKSFLDLLNKKYSSTLDETAKKYIHYAVDGAVRMSVLISDLLSYSISGSDSSVEMINLNEIVEGILNLNRYSLQHNPPIFNIGKLPVVSYSKSGMTQLLQNLITNAVKYKSNSTQSVININAKDLGEFWEISVKDNGIGVAEENLEQIFVMFKRLHSKSDYSGTGIGLATCKKIVEKANGSIWAESQLGKGSVFFFTISKIS